MSNQPSSLPSTERGTASDPLDPKRALSADALQRRRMLLKGAGGGGAALVALTPLNALAGNQTMFCKNKDKTGNVIATVSGVQSAAASLAARQMPEAGGCSPSKWANKPSGEWPCAQTKQVGDVCGWTSRSCKSMSFLSLLRNTSDYQTERHWVCAYINALAHEKSKLPSGYSFPYTSSEVLNYISNQDSKAHAFFSGYMEAL